MNELAPPNPPHRTRGGRTPPRETSSSLLMSVIRTLSTSENNEQRELEKRRLEKEYKKSDGRLESLVVSNAKSLKEVMEIFGVVSSRLTESRERLRTIKNNLVACKQLLHCKRDELKERWLEGIEHKHVMLLLEQIEEVQDVGERIGGFMVKKHYLHATKILMSSLRKLETDLKKVEALKEVHADLQARKEKVHTILIEELHNHLYHRWTKEILALRRHGSGRDSFNLIRAGSHRASTEASREEKARKNLFDALSYSSAKQPNFSDSIHEDISNSDPESNPQHFMAIIVECLALLGKLPDSVEAVKSRMQKELTIIVQKTSKHILDLYPSLNEDIRQPTSVFSHSALYKAESKEAKLLQELFQTVFEQFQLVVVAHQALLTSVRKSSDHHGIELILYTMPDVWSKVQATLQVVLTDYLNLSQLGNPQQQTPAAFTEATTDLSIFFSKKKVNRPKTYSLFKFDASYHAITMNNYLMERKMKENEEDLANNETSIVDGNIVGRKSREDVIINGTKLDASSKYDQKHLLVCQPSPHNITVLFNILQSFIKEIEDALGCTPGTHCTLSVFVMDYVRDAFLVQLHVENANRLEQATKMLDQWKTSNDVRILRSLKITKPVLQSTITVWQSIEDLRWLLRALPTFADHFVSMICKTLLNYKETCQAGYRGITQPESEEKRVISATWAKDEDIKRFLKDLPNWVALQRGISGNVRNDSEENPEEIGERNRKEAEILTGNLGDQLIPEHEILSDPNQLRVLAHLQESLEWFSEWVLKFATSLPLKSASRGVSGDLPPISDASAQVLISLAKDFEELSHTCLIVLHLEVRVHCFYYLLPVARGGGFATGIDSQEPDPEVLKLNKDLAVIDEALTATMQPRKCKYIFEGLGPLIANILTAWVVHIRRINENGIKKMCRNIFRIQQQLTNITMTRELALDKARQYYETLYLSPDDILNNIVNRGKQFTELEYMNALHLLHRSQSDAAATQESLQVNLQRLSEILGDVGVTV